MFAKEKNLPLKICDTSIEPGERLTLALPTPEIYTCAPTYIPIHVIHGKKSGPCLLVCAAIHGDEVNGVAIIQRLLELSILKKIRGTLIAVPVFNIYGLISQTRYLPDRRDLDGSFPGSEIGSFASRLAKLITKEILSKATHCIDIHTGEPHYYRLPQIYTNSERPDALKMAKAFHAPIIFHAETKKGMLWQMEKNSGIPTIIFEGGEANRLNDFVVKTGMKGIIRVMKDLDMLKIPIRIQKPFQPQLVKSSTWIRAPGSGICQIYKKIGAHVKEQDRLALISDPFGTGQKFQVLSPVEGVIIAQNYQPLVNEGEMILQIANIKKAEDVNWQMEPEFEEP